jgi:hypothetical protein
VRIAVLLIWVGIWLATLLIGVSLLFGIVVSPF